MLKSVVVEIEPKSKYGKVYNLLDLKESLELEYFNTDLGVNIRWGQLPRRGKVSVIGRYTFATRTISISPLLDDEFVPKYFIKYVIYHELLHSIFPVPIINGRAQYHTPEFNRAEAMFRDYEKALTWEVDNIDILRVSAKPKTR